MIRRLTAQDHEAVMALVQPKAAENVFLIGDIEAYGYDDAIQTIWGEFEGEALIAVLLRYDSNYIPYATGTFNVDAFGQIIMQHEGPFEVSGLAHLVKPIIAQIDCAIIQQKDTYYAACYALAYEPNDSNLQAVERLTAADYAEEVEMLLSIPEFKHAQISVAARQRAAQYKTGRTYIMRQGGQIVASASTTAENSQSAMIVGVGTKPGYTRQGYATYCMEKLCGELLAEGKSLCLFYDNPVAGKIYKRLGFEDIGMWTMVRYVGNH